MNKLVSLFFAFGVLAASAAPLVFDKALLGGHADMVKVMHGAHVPASGAKLRFLFLLPKVGAAVDGFKTGTNGAHALDLLAPPAGHHLVHLFGLADCADWLAVHVAFFHPTHGLVDKFVAGGKTDFAEVTGGFDAFVNFLKDKVATKAALAPLWPMLPAHPAVLKLHGLLA